MPNNILSLTSKYVFELPKYFDFYKSGKIRKLFRFEIIGEKLFKVENISQLEEMVNMISVIGVSANQMMIYNIEIVSSSNGHVVNAKYYYSNKLLKEVQYQLL
jgi:hypothetical protein